MAVTVLALTNPGGEAGNTSGWSTNVFTLDFGVSNAEFATGSYSLRINDTEFNGFYQDYTLSGGEIAAADTGGMIVHASVAQKSSASGHEGYLYIAFYDGSDVLISSFNAPSSGYASNLSWTTLERYALAPVGTRKIRIGVFNNFSINYWDDFVLEYSTVGSDFPESTLIDMFQLGTYALAAQPAESAIVSQSGTLALGNAETASGLHDTHFHQAGVYALVRGFADRENLRAWQFPQDDHLFYVLQLGNGNGTLVVDMLTEQWSVWKSPGYEFWRGADGIDWEGMNVCCDPISGKLFRIDPDGRLDYGTTPIESTVTGQATVRMRKMVSCFAAELAVSDAAPAADGVTITLETSDDGELTFLNHGSLSGATGEMTTFRWFGLGLMQAPGRIFRIRDTGHARRIDGLDIEVA